MGPTIHVELTGRREFVELIDALRQRGLDTAVSETDDHCELSIGYHTDPAKRLRSEVGDAIRGWLARSDAPLVLVEAAPDEYILRPPAE